jgi:uncharacterized protein YfbU (UPF0304 family)
METHMKLSKIERLLLINQFTFLERLNPGEASFYADTILEEGYEGHYLELTGSLSDGLSAERSDELTAILNMYRSLNFSYDDLQETSGIDKAALEFPGLDGNEEGRELRYILYRLEDRGDFKELSENSENVGFNSHMPMLDTYRNMLRTWANAGNQAHLTRDEILDIIRHL